MRRLRALIAGFMLLFILFGQVAVAADDIIIDVENGNLITGSYNIPLNPTADRPISIGMEDGNVILVVQTDAGSTIRLNLGQGRVALTTRANPFVRLEQASGTSGGATGGTEGQDDGSGNCVKCGRPLSVGNHSRYPCGHYVCVVGRDHPGGICPTCGEPMCDGGDHTVCPRCGKGYCNHDDNACSYRHNPAPTPFQMIDPVTGEIVYTYTDPAGGFTMGNPTGEKAEEWSPGQEFMHGTWPLPSPIPTWHPSNNPPFCEDEDCEWWQAVNAPWKVADPPRAPEAWETPGNQPVLFTSVHLPHLKGKAPAGWLWVNGQAVEDPAYGYKSHTSDSCD